jgi:starch phosphorylase
MQCALINIDMETRYKEALMEIGYKIEDIFEEEVDPALGNGGLGRLAACFLDSLASLEIPAWGYGIRYDYGIFKQAIVDGHQVETPDFWLGRGNPWEIERHDVVYPVRFYGYLKKYKDGSIERAHWEGGEIVQAMAYDIPIPGFNTFNTNNLRLWRSRPYNEFDFKQFNAGDYHGAIMERQKAEYITSVLYPNDSSE